ncbi:hypothetical protein HKD37_04G010245 [Glycine soja]
MTLLLCNAAAMEGIKTFSVQNKVVQSARELSQRALRGRGSRVCFPKEERCAESPPTFICGKCRENRRKPVKMKILSSGVVFTLEEGRQKRGFCFYVPSFGEEIRPT